MIIKTTIVVHTEFDGDDSAEFRALPEPEQNEILARNEEQLIEVLREHLPEDSAFKVKFEEVEPE
jgi:hypothetical protein